MVVTKKTQGCISANILNDKKNNNCRESQFHHSIAFNLTELFIPLQAIASHCDEK